MALLSFCNNFELKSYFLEIAFGQYNEIHLTIRVFNTSDDGHEFQFLDKIQLSALGIHHLTMYHTHWRHLNSSSYATGTVAVVVASSKSGVIIFFVCHFFNKLLHVKS